MDCQNEGYFLSSDDDGHWYIVPKSKEMDWGIWLNLDSEDEESWTVPSYAKPINGSPSKVTFFNYTV